MNRKQMNMETMYEWANEMNCAVTVCDTEGIILYMNEKACRTFAKHGDLIGKNPIYSRKFGIKTRKNILRSFLLNLIHQKILW